MVRKRVLAPLLFVAGLLAVIGLAYVVLPFVSELPCCPEEPEDLRHGSSPAPCPGGGGGGEDDVICLRVPFAVVLALGCVVSYAAGGACHLLTQRLADGDEEDEASGAAMKAGYVAIAADGLEAGTGGGNN